MKKRGREGKRERTEKRMSGKGSTECINNDEIKRFLKLNYIVNENTRSAIVVNISISSIQRFYILNFILIHETL